MACSPKFKKTIDIACVLEIVSDIRAQKDIVPIVEKIIWVVGCGVKYMVPAEHNVALTYHHSDDALVGELEAAAKLTKGLEDQGPEVVWILMQLLSRYLSKVQI